MLPSLPPLLATFRMGKLRLAALFAPSPQCLHSSKHSRYSDRGTNGIHREHMKGPRSHARKFPLWGVDQVNGNLKPRLFVQPTFKGERGGQLPRAQECAPP